MVKRNGEGPWWFGRRTGSPAELLPVATRCPGSVSDSSSGTEELQASGKLCGATRSEVRTSGRKPDALDKAYQLFSTYFSSPAERMQRQAVVVGARQATAAVSRAPRSTTAAGEVTSYRLTRRIHNGSVLNLFRAATRNEMGPGCYVLKRPRDGASPELAAAMLRREATVAAAVKHPNLTCVVASETHSSQPHLLLPFRDGVSLQRILLLSGAFTSVPRALNIVRQVGEALAALHAAGWIHGRVRPEHVLLSPQGQAVVIDLSQARRMNTAECDSGVVAAADAAYAAPETTARGHRLDCPADVYSLGVLLYEILAGRRPFEGCAPRELMIKHRRDAIPEIRPMRPDVAFEVAHLLRLMLAKEALRRPTDGDLVRWLAELEIAALAI